MAGQTLINGGGKIPWQVTQHLTPQSFCKTELQCLESDEIPSIRNITNGEPPQQGT